MEISEKLKELRSELEISQLEMGKRLGVSMHTYYLWEKASIKPRFDRIATINKMYQEMVAEQKKRQVA